jgi:hypothetical protein
MGLVSLLQVCSTWGPAGPHFTNIGYHLLLEQHFHEDRRELLGNRDGAAAMSYIAASVRIEVRRRRRIVRVRAALEIPGLYVLFTNNEITFSLLLFSAQSIGTCIALNTRMSTY